MKSSIILLNRDTSEFILGARMVNYVQPSQVHVVSFKCIISVAITVRPYLAARI